MRLGGVLPATRVGSLTMALLGWSGIVVKVDQVGKVFTEVALMGAKESIVENRDIVKFKKTASL